MEHTGAGPLVQPPLSHWGKKRILHLTIKYKWFVEIAEGRKPYEFREVKPYWTKRLFNSDGTAKEFDEIHIRNGYTMDRPFIRSQWWGFHIRSYDNGECYAIDVGDIIEVRSKVLKTFKSDKHF